MLSKISFISLALSSALTLSPVVARAAAAMALPVVHLGTHAGFAAPSARNSVPPITIAPGPATGREKLVNFGLVAGAQVVSYLITQHDIINDHGSWDNWIKNIPRPHFDYDNFDYNIFYHSFVGHYYYMFYRSRGYSERSSFFWSIASSSLFEFGIESFTERPSFQDLYLTPVFGTIVGMGMERISTYLHSINTYPTHILGYLFNPMTLIPGAKCDCAVMPAIGKKGEPGVNVTLRF